MRDEPFGLERSGLDTVEPPDSFTNVADVIDQLREEVTQLRAERDAAQARVAELDKHCVRLGRGGAERYWEGRYRDEAARSDAAARDMRERCAKVAETADRPGKEWLALVQTMAGSEAMRRVIVEDIRVVSLIATTCATPSEGKS